MDPQPMFVADRIPAEITPARAPFMDEENNYTESVSLKSLYVGTHAYPASGQQ
jgi:hypothetical protein